MDMVKKHMVEQKIKMFAAGALLSGLAASTVVPLLFVNAAGSIAENSTFIELIISLLGGYFAFSRFK